MISTSLFADSQKAILVQPMKSTKHSLLNQQSNYEVDPQNILLEESSRPFSSPQNEVPYSALSEPPARPPQIQMTRMRSPQNIQNNQQKYEVNEKCSSRISQPQQRASGTGSKMMMGPQQTSAVYTISSQYRGSMIHVTPQSMSVMPREPYVPPVEAQCPHCQCKQHIPGSAEQYYCGKCHELNDIDPKFGFFKCGVCRQKVCYPFRTSDHIQCNICYSINIVPTTISSSKVRLSSLNESAMVLPKDLQEEGTNMNDEVTTGKDEQEYPQM